MRIILLYDLPMQEDDDKKIYQKFHKDLVKIGFHMLQYSVYTKSSQNDDNYIQIKKYIDKVLPKKGQIIFFKITEKQYLNMVYLNGIQNNFDIIVGNKEFVVFKGEDID